MGPSQRCTPSRSTARNVAAPGRNWSAPSAARQEKSTGSLEEEGKKRERKKKRKRNRRIAGAARLSRRTEFPVTAKRAVEAVTQEKEKNVAGLPVVGWLVRGV